jgi:hypothetical protein
MREIKVYEPPLKYFLPPKQNRITKIRKKVVGFAKSLFGYFKLFGSSRIKKIDKNI